MLNELLQIIFISFKRQIIYGIFKIKKITKIASVCFFDLFTNKEIIVLRKKLMISYFAT